MLGLTVGLDFAGNGLARHVDGDQHPGRHHRHQDPASIPQGDQPKRLFAADRDRRHRLAGRNVDHRDVTRAEVRDVKEAAVRRHRQMNRLLTRGHREDLPPRGCLMGGHPVFVPVGEKDRRAVRRNREVSGIAALDGAPPITGGVVDFHGVAFPGGDEHGPAAAGDDVERVLAGGHGAYGAGRREIEERERVVLPVGDEHRRRARHGDAMRPVSRFLGGDHAMGPGVDRQHGLAAAHGDENVALRRVPHAGGDAVGPVGARFEPVEGQGGSASAQHRRSGQDNSEPSPHGGAPICFPPASAAVRRRAR